MIHKGTYSILAELNDEAKVVVASGKTFTLKRGFYGYVGSALNGIEKRVARHLTDNKKFHWHIDYLLSLAVVRLVVCAENDKPSECLIAHTLSQDLLQIIGFGCSDCTCRSHLFYAKDFITLKTNTINTFTLHGLNPYQITPARLVN